MKTTTVFIILLALICIAPMVLSQVVFDHVVHREDAEMECEACHSPDGGGQPYLALMPSGDVCLDCHDEDVLAALPEVPHSHVGDFRQAHQFNARAGDTDCKLCHGESESCTLCHAGENLDLLAHDRNWMYDHPLAVNKQTEDCAACHDTETYCGACHASLGVKPASHMVEGWTTGGLASPHAIQGSADLYACMSCHDALSPGLCSGCHPGMGE